MKTKNLLTLPKIPFLSLLAVGGILVSCGSYQNSSYNDNDGIYNSSQKTNDNSTAQVAEDNTNAAYQNYFRSKQLAADDEIFVDVEEYTSVNDSTETRQASSSDGSWGSNPSSVTVNVYSSNWGVNYWNNWYSPYWGYNNWYGSYWGIGWGWGYPSYGWGYPYYGGGYGYC